MIQLTRNTRAVLGALAAVLLVGIGTSGAQAEDAANQTWAVVPASAAGPDGRPQLDYLVEPGTEAVDHIAIRNFGTEPLTVDLYAHDATQSQDGAFDLLTTDEAASAVGDWVRLDASTVTVPARDLVVVPIRIDIPSDAEPGDHAGGIVAVNVVEGGSFSTQYRVGTRVYVRVAGPVNPELTVAPVGGVFDSPLSPTGSGRLSVDATFVNTGNIRLEPRAEARITSLFGLWESEVAFVDTAEILPTSAVTLTTALDGVPALGPLWVTVDVPTASSSGQELVEQIETRSITVVVWAVPWILLITILLLAGAAIVAIVNIRRRRRARTEEETERSALGRELTASEL